MIFYETQNLIESKDKAVKKALNKFQNLVNGFPDTDASPNYETLKSPSDIEKEKSTLQQKADALERTMHQCQKP